MALISFEGSQTTLAVWAIVLQWGKVSEGPCCPFAFSHSQYLHWNWRPVQEYALCLCQDQLFSVGVGSVLWRWGVSLWSLLWADVQVLTPVSAVIGYRYRFPECFGEKGTWKWLKFDDSYKAPATVGWLSDHWMPLEHGFWWFKAFWTFWLIKCSLFLLLTFCFLCVPLAVNTSVINELFFFNFIYFTIM